MKRIIPILLTLLAYGTAQVNLDVQFTPYVTYYISSIDLNTGESNLPIFSGELSTNADSSYVALEFEIQVTSEILDLDNETLIRAYVEPFYLRAPIFITNQDLTLNTRELYDVNGVQVPIHVRIDEQIAIDEADALINSIIQLGKLPNGVYRFSVRVIDGFDESTVLTQEQDVLSVTSPTELQLISPGGVLADTSLNEVFTSYPVFQWESDPCNVPGGCDYYMRVAEFDPEEHESMEQAIDSQTRLPLDQSEEWYFVGSGMFSFQYPVTGAGDLEAGEVYVWQMKKDLATTSGVNEIMSELYAFKVKDLSGGGDETTGGDEGSDTSPEALALQAAIGAGTYSELFGPGAPLENYHLTGLITLDGQEIDMATIQSWFSQGIPATDSTGATIYEIPEIISVEVSE